MEEKKATPLLLLDNASMSVINEGEFKCTNLTFEEAKAIIEMHQDSDILRCFSNNQIEDIIFNYLGIEKKEFLYKPIRNMRVSQDAIIFKLYITPSETQPVIEADFGVLAKKIQNIYVYCQLISRLK